MDNKLYEWLRSAGLGKYFPSFTSYGVTADNLTDLPLQDYSAVGVNAMGDRRKLFQLIQLIKGGGDPTPASTPKPKSTPNPAPSQPHPVVRKERERESKPLKAKLAQPRLDVKEEPNARPSSQNQAPTPHSTPAVASQPRLQPASSQHTPQQSPPANVSREGRIRVVVRKRPMNKKEIRQNEVDIVSAVDWNVVGVNVPKVKVDLTKYVEENQFTFDEVFGDTKNTNEVYHNTAFPLIDYIFKTEKSKATCFAYGQTGSGKTFTMQGDGTNGIYQLAANDIFKRRDSDPRFQNLTVSASYFEIYVGRIYDLLKGRRRLEAREDSKHNVVIVGLTEYKTATADDLYNLLRIGNENRATSPTGMHDDSSRSHALLQIALYHPDGKLKGKFTFVDLAGSEYGSVSANSDRQTRIEGAEINKSLLALKECIRSLDRKSHHTPFRQSKLTQVLKDSFVGKCRTVMIATLAPNSGSSENTLNTLRYADRVKELGSKKVSSAASRNIRAQMDGLLGAPKPSRAPARRGAGGARKVVRPWSQQDEEAYAKAREPEPAESGEEEPEHYSEDDFEDEDEEGGANEEEGQEEEEEISGNTEEERQLARFQRDHEKVVADIVNRQESFIVAHRDQIDRVIHIARKEMALLNAVEQPGADVDKYVNDLQLLLKEKLDVVSVLSGQLHDLKQVLDKEEDLSKTLKR
eukprot:GCRY01003109.1.p1 GENE.GCRY01003109.1~~GCRY01003109.1.p1  ORF type:complete len:692 (-),score=226.56 GCRY01003109.1:265-2340(-)